MESNRSYCYCLSTLRQIEYYEQVRTPGGKKRDEKTVFPARSPVPQGMQKKATLLEYFKNYLTENSKVKEESFTPSPDTPVYVQRWMRTKHAIIFRLSNKGLQVIIPSMQLTC